LLKLGLQPHLLSNTLLDSLINIAIKYRDRIDPTQFLPTVNWRNARNDRHAQKPQPHAVLDKSLV
jgi:UDP-sulfoquinovose synthase